MKCNADTVCTVVRWFSFFTYLCTLAAAGWGFILAHQRFSDNSQNLGAGLTAVNLAVFQGLMAFYYVVFGILGALSEIRTDSITRKVMKHFGFMRTWLGRGIFLIYIGTIFVLLPWDEERPYVAKVPGAFQLASGTAQVLLSLIVRKDETRFRLTPNGGSGVGDPVTPVPKSAAERIRWGEPDTGVTVTDALPAADTGATPARSLLGADAATRVVMNPLGVVDASSADASSGSGSGSGSGAVVRNPFTQS